MNNSMYIFIKQYELIMNAKKKNLKCVLFKFLASFQVVKKFRFASSFPLNFLRVSCAFLNTFLYAVFGTSD